VKRGASTISPHRLDQLFELAIVAVKQVFKENGFRFLPKIIEPAIAAGELIRKKSIFFFNRGLNSIISELKDFVISIVETVKTIASNYLLILILATS
jgi:hypothetical protein|tara:strand:+ start:211 stop:501 length:291 start_codon:yes stop_codon:yes gene_type:complete